MCGLFVLVFTHVCYCGSAARCYHGAISSHLGVCCILSHVSRDQHGRPGSLLSRLHLLLGGRRVCLFFGGLIIFTWTGGKWWAFLGRSWCLRRFLSVVLIILLIYIARDGVMRMFLKHFNILFVAPVHALIHDLNLYHFLRYGKCRCLWYPAK